MSRFAACFAEDADFVNVRGWWWRGRGEIEPTHALLHETMFSDSFMELERAATKEVGAGVVVMHVKWRMAGHERGGPQQTSEPRTGIWSWVIRDREGRLEIVSSQQHRHDRRPVDSSARGSTALGRSEFTPPRPLRPRPPMTTAGARDTRFPLILRRKPPQQGLCRMAPARIELAHADSKSAALSTELRGLIGQYARLGTLLKIAPCS